MSQIVLVFVPQFSPVQDKFPWFNTILLQRMEILSFTFQKSVHPFYSLHKKFYSLIQRYFIPSSPEGILSLQQWIQTFSITFQSCTSTLFIYKIILKIFKFTLIHFVPLYTIPQCLIFIDQTFESRSKG